MLLKDTNGTKIIELELSKLHRPVGKLHSSNPSNNKPPSPSKTPLSQMSDQLNREKKINMMLEWKNLAPLFMKSKKRKPKKPKRSAS